MIRIVLAEDHAIVRAGLKQMFAIAYSTRWRTRFHADGGQRSSVIADTVPR